MTAPKMMDIIEEAITSLAVMPQKCPPVTDERLAMTGYRKLLVKNYIVFFTIDEKLWRQSLTQDAIGFISCDGYADSGSVAGDQTRQRVCV
jgi:toxin ParE1/3/4